MIILKELVEQADEELKEFFSLKNQDQYISTTEEVMGVSHHLNSYQLVRGCGLKEGVDYIPVKFDTHEAVVKALIKAGLCKSHHTSKTTIFFESGIWKVALCSKSQTGIDLREYLVNQVLPAMVSERKSNVSILSSLKQNK